MTGIHLETGPVLAHPKRRALSVGVIDRAGVGVGELNRAGVGIHDHSRAGVDDSVSHGRPGVK